MENSRMLVAMGFVKRPFVHDNNSTNFTSDGSSSDQFVHRYLAIGLTFLGGMVAGFFIYCFFALVMRFFRESELELELEQLTGNRRNGVFNLSFAGDDTGTLVDDHPPDYATVVCDGSPPVAATTQKEQSTWLRIFRRSHSASSSAAASTDGSPPSYADTVLNPECGTGTDYNVT